MERTRFRIVGNGLVLMVKTWKKDSGNITRIRATAIIPASKFTPDQLSAIANRTYCI
jgi:hypothetical protein